MKPILISVFVVSAAVLFSSCATKNEAQISDQSSDVTSGSYGGTPKSSLQYVG